MEKSNNHKVGIVIPMYNEIDNIPTLHYKMKGVVKILSDDYLVHLFIVNDGSTDHTLELIQQYFSSLPNITIINLKKNMGYSDALRSGIDVALDQECRLILTIDADTNYDHFYIPLFLDSFDMEKDDIITASPWHPDGQRKFFPKNRLVLSLGLSALYRYVLKDYGQPLYTYSACFRVAKAEVYQQIRWTGKGFMANSEILARCIIKGLRVREIPFHVNPRWFGMSKMAILRQITMHIKFLWSLKGDPSQYSTSIEKEKDDHSSNLEIVVSKSS